MCNKYFSFEGVCAYTPFMSSISVFDVIIAIIARYFCILKLGCTAIITFSNQAMAINRS